MMPNRSFSFETESVQPAQRTRRTRRTRSARRLRLPRLFALVLPLAVVLGAVAGAPADARLVRQQIEVTVEPSGDVVRRSRLSIRLDTASELDEWSPYPIVLDENRQLSDLSAWIVRPDGRRIDLKKAAFDTVEQPGDGVLHDSTSYRTVRFPPSAAGTTLHLDFTVRAQPYFPDDALRLGSSEPVDELSVRIEAPDDMRWHLAAPDPVVEALQIDEQPRRLTLQAADFPPEDFDPPILRFSWGQAETWADVATWYDELVGAIPRNAPQVNRRAAEVIAGSETNAAKIEAVLDFVRREVRYVAVEVGIGGYRPSSPEETLDRRWGDCKDKSFLLIDLLDAVGIDAYPALLLASDDSGIDPAFPTPGQFNHLIVALPQSTINPDQEASSYLFLDPTLTKGRLSWLPPAIQGQEALVIRGADSRLVTTPVDSGLEGRELDVRVTIDEAGEARGQATLTLKGRFGSALTDITSDSDRSLVARSLLGTLLPGAQLDQLAWGTDDLEGVPVATVSAEIALAGFVRGGATGSFQLPASVLSPATSTLDEVRQFPLALEASTFDTAWRLDLPTAWCPIAPADREIDNRVGAFRQEVVSDGSVVTVRRHSEISQRWLAEGDIEAARELALTERRAQKRRLRLRCP